jgi:ABC-2 type transport system permease protein
LRIATARIEHLLVMPVTPLEIMVAKVWSMGLVVLTAAFLSLTLVMLAAPTTHFVELAQAILYRGAGFEAVWAPLLALATIGAVLFALSLARFRKTIALMA